jgi:hypothetical protein
MFTSLKQFKDHLYFKDMFSYRGITISYYETELFCKYLIEKKQTKQLSIKELKECNAVVYRKYNDHYITYVFTLRGKEHLEDTEFLLKHFLSGAHFHRMIEYTQKYIKELS